MQVETLDAPLFLIAMPQVQDPFFHRSVVLLVEHSAEGSFGIVINRPLELTISSVIGDLGITWAGQDDAVVYLGGPVQPNAGLTLFGGGEHEEAAREIAPGIHLANDTDTLKRVASVKRDHFRLLVGYSGWGAGQLEDELARNDWLIAPIDASLIFSFDAAAVWSRALESIGVRPESLPAATSNDDHTSN